MPYTQYSLDTATDTFSRSEVYFKRNMYSSDIRNIYYSNINKLNSYDLSDSSDILSYENDILSYENVKSFYSLYKDNFPVSYSLIITKNFQTSLQSFFDYKSTLDNPFELSLPNPIAVRYVSLDGTHFIERPPFQIEVDFSVNYSKTKSMPPVKIWIPWTLFVLNPSTPQDSYIYFSHKSLSSMEDVYLNCPLPNIYNDSRICYSNSLYHLDYTSTDVRYLYSTLFNEYMSGGWNLDLPSSLEYIFRQIAYHQFSYTNDNIEERFKNIPTIRKFFYPDLDKIKSSYSGRLTSSYINKYFKESNYIHRVNNITSNRLTFFKYFFLVMSSFTLEETLQFYHEIFNHFVEKPNSISSFSEIVKRNSFTSTSQAKYYSQKMSNDFCSFISRTSLSDTSSVVYDVLEVPFIVNTPSSDHFHPNRNYLIESLLNQYHDLIDKCIESQNQNLSYKNYIDISFDSSNKPIFTLKFYPSFYKTFESYYYSLFPSYFSDGTFYTTTVRQLLDSHNDFSISLEGSYSYVD